MSGESFNRYFRLIHSERQRRPSGRLWCPAADVYSTRDGWIVKVDLAGIRPKDIEINVEGPFLAVRGRRAADVCGDAVFHYHLEIPYGRSEKQIAFPRSIE